MEAKDKILGNRVGYTFFGIFTIVALYFVVETGFVNRDGRYVIGMYVKSIGGGKSIGVTRYYEYFYDGKKYIDHIKGIGSYDRLRFIKVLPYKPSVSRFIDTRVPPCINMADVPPLGWKELPKDTCR